MYILQNGKLYAQEGDKLVGVNISLGKIEKLKETAKLGKDFQVLTPAEVRAKFNIMGGGSYKFPVPKKVTKKTEVVNDGTTKSTKKSTGRSSRK